MNRKLSTLLIVVLLLVLAGYHFKKADERHIRGGLNPAVFSAKTPEDSLEVYGLYQTFLSAEGFVPSSDSELFGSFPGKIYPTSKQDWYLRGFDQEKILLQVDVSEHGFFPHMKWDARGFGSDERDAEARGLEFAVKASEWIETVSDKNQIRSGGWKKARDEYALKLKHLNQG
ncbi:hypothetical protein AAFN60_21385 [Roseibacillus persicicus]|uniref:hypothetical protein n=1 Tax=Roseibacillus persicicus TaxID=454148 RepID=UPI00398ACC17